MVKSGIIEIEASIRKPVNSNKIIVGLAYNIGNKAQVFKETIQEDSIDKNRYDTMVDGLDCIFKRIQEKQGTLKSNGITDIIITISNPTLEKWVLNRAGNKDYIKKVEEIKSKYSFGSELEIDMDLYIEVGDCKVTKEMCKSAEIHEDRQSKIDRTGGVNRINIKCLQMKESTAEIEVEGIIEE